jgi:hemerythrin-like domain-containing protein
MKRILADLLESGAEDAQFDAKMSVLKEQVEHHVDEEEKALFPKVRKACSEEELEDLGDRMQRMAEDLEEKGEPSAQIPGQTDAPSRI